LSIAIKPPVRIVAGRSGVPVNVTPSKPKQATPTGPPVKPLQVTKPVSTLTGGVTVHTSAGDMNLNVRGLQVQLKKDGYDLAVDGKLGPQTLSALRDYYKPTAHLDPALAHVLDHGAITGTRDPQAWNKRFGTDT
jgi:Predicted Peptidoglycan domain